MYTFDQIAPVMYEYKKIRFYIKFQWASPNHEAPCRALMMYESNVPGLGVSIGIIGADWQSYDAAWDDVRLATHSWAETHPMDVKNAATIEANDPALSSSVQTPQESGPQT